MKTAMQELIEWCNSCLTDKTMSEGGRIALEVTIVRANDLLEKEKKQIIEAYAQGHKIGWVLREAYFNDTDKIALMDENYYNQTYNN